MRYKTQGDSRLVKEKKCFYETKSDPINRVLVYCKFTPSIIILAGKHLYNLTGDRQRRAMFLDDWHKELCSNHRPLC